ncbi:MAG: hypothetical protein JWM90_766 [Thermoleophilia bacterium]|nr:hypothetical protein [Thermoleophilia bacterium]
MSQRSPLTWARPYIVVLAVWATASGGLVAADILDQPAGSGRSAATATAAAPTPTLQVGKPALLQAPTAKALAGQTHGIQGYLPRHQQLVQVPITLTNTTDRSMPYDPRWFRLGGRKQLQPSTSTMQAGVLRPSATIDGTVGFVAPRDGRRLILIFDAPQAPAVQVPLGGSGRVVPPTPNATTTQEHHER